MRKFKVEVWKSRMQDKNTGGYVKNEDGTFYEYDESILTIISVLINNKKPEEMPRGLDKFRLFSRLAAAFDKSKESGELVLEETDYKFLKDMIEKDVPSVWGFNTNILKAIDIFLETKEG